MKKFHENEETFENKNEELYMASEEMEDAMFAAEEIVEPVVSFINGTVVGGSLNVRSKETTSSEIVEVLPEGTLVTAKEPVETEWVEIETPNMNKGFIMAKFIKWDEE